MVENCPVCGKHISSAKCCDLCGFDDSCNYEAHITLGPVPAGVRSLAGMRLDYKQKYQNRPADAFPFMRFLKLTGIDLNQPWAPILEDESLCKEIDRILSTGVSLAPPEANHPASAARPKEREFSAPVTPKAAEVTANIKAEKSTPPAPVRRKAEEIAPAVSVKPKADGTAVSEKMRTAISHYTTGQRPPVSDFKLDSSGKILEKYIGDGGNVVIPEGIVEIGPRAFSHQCGVYSVKFPGSLTWIGGGAFANCIGLEELTLPSGIQISPESFWGCTSLRKVTLCPGITCIPRSTFQCCRKLQEVILPEGLTSIGFQAFCNCDSLREIVIPKSVTEMEERIFFRFKKSIFRPPVTIYAPARSCAQKYARKNNLRFRAI